MVCACAGGNWETATVKTEEVEKFLGATKVRSDGDEDALWLEPKVTNEGLHKVSDNIRLAQIVVMTLNTAAFTAISYWQHEIASGYLKIAQGKWERYKGTYVPCEIQEMFECCNMPLYEAEHDVRAGSYGGIVNTSLASGRALLSRRCKRYCLTEAAGHVSDFRLAGAMQYDDTVNFAYRYEESREDMRSDRDWNRRSQALNRGRNIESEAYRTSQAAVNAFSDLGGIAGRVAQGASRAYGFYSARKETGYPSAPQSMFLTPPHNRGLVAGGVGGGSSAVNNSQTLWNSSQSGLDGSSFAHDVGVQLGGSSGN